MSSLDSFIKGTCMDMCPRAERELREREGLVHPLEANDADFTRAQQCRESRPTLDSLRPTSCRKVRYCADRKLMVKSYQRSAAGMKMTSAENLRPASVLIHTVEHLLNDVVHSSRVPWCEVHGFVSDRLRCVRQDANIQQIDPASYVTILASCVGFYAYSSYRHCNEHSTPCIDAHLNRKQLEECLSSCITLYDELSPDVVTPCRLEIECVHLLLNIETYDVLQRALKLKQYSCIALTLELCLHFSLHNYRRVFKLLPHIPPLAVAVFAAHHLATFRKKCLGIINAGFSCRNNFLPLCYIQHCLLLSTEDQVRHLCAYYGLEVDCEKNRVACNKAAFQVSKTTETIFTSLDFIDTEILLSDKLDALNLSGRT